MNCEDMNDFEINQEVALKIRGRDAVSVIDTPLNKLVRIFNGNPKSEEDSCWVDFDPCNNPSDAWPIIVGNSISINHGKTVIDDEWVDIWFVGAGMPEAQERTTDKSKVLRAAMICFLKMKDAEK